MTSETQNKTTSPNNHEHHLTRENNFNDEIDLRELILQIWAQRYILLVTSLICFIIGIVALKFYPKTYEVSTVLQRASENQLAANSPALSAELNSVSLFNTFWTLLQSESNYLEYKKNNNIREKTVAQIISEFKGFNFKILSPVSKKGTPAMHPELVNISLSGRNSLEIGDNLKNYITYINQKTLNKIRKNFTLHKAQLITNIETSINTGKQKYKQEHQSELTKRALANEELIQLKEQEIKITGELALQANKIQIRNVRENLLLANALGVVEPTSMDSFVDRPVKKTTKKDNLTIVSNSTLPPPLYLMGSNFLEKKIEVLMALNEEDIISRATYKLVAELETLKFDIKGKAYAKRAKTDAYIEAFPQLYAQQNMLETINIDWSQIQPFDTISQPQKIGVQTKPKMALSLALIFLLSCFIGLGTAIIQSILKK